MKLLTFSEGESGKHQFGVVVNNRIYSFDAIQLKFGTQHSGLHDIYAYLNQLPESQQQAQQLVNSIQQTSNEADMIESFGLDEIRIHSPIPNPAALLDFGLTPRHLKNSAYTLLKHEFNPILIPFIKPFINRKMDNMAQSEILPYYKGNHHAISGYNDTVHWPSYTSYLDIEPELAIVYGNERQPIAGYTILNDMSARDVQFPEMIGTGPARSKDFDRSNGMGPFMVTPDEIDNPLDLKVTARIGNRFEWHGNTSEYCRKPEEVIAFAKSVFTLKPGTVLGMGTIPDCTGLDHNLWLLPGERIEITFDKLGTLKQHIPKNIGSIEASRWKSRQELFQFYRKP